MEQGARIKIPAELFALAESSHFEGELDLGALQAGPDDYAFAQPVSWEVDVTNTGEALLVAGQAHSIATTSCARCLDEVEYDVDGQIEGYYLIEGESEAPDDLDDDEYDELPADHIIDLEPLIVAGFLVELPQVPLCDDDCKGLCPMCGANLNDGDCGCAPDEELEQFEQAKNPFAALANLSFDEN